MGGYSYRWRVARAVEALGAAADAVGPVTPGMAVFGVSRGQFAMIDMIQHVLSQTGPAAVSLWTWTIADYERDMIAALMATRLHGSDKTSYQVFHRPVTASLLAPSGVALRPRRHGTVRAYRV